MTQPSITSTNKPAIVRAIFWAFDVLATALILALAIRGAASFVKTASSDVKVGVAVTIVGLLAMRLIERIFDQRR